MTEQRPNVPSEAELAKMTPDQLVRLGVALDDVELVEYYDRWPVKGTRAETRAERGVAGWFALAAVSGLAFLAVYIFGRGGSGRLAPRTTSCTWFTRH